MITIVNTGTAAVRVAGRYLQPGDQCPVAEEIALLLTRNNPAVVAAPAVPEEFPETVEPPVDFALAAPRAKSTAKKRMRK